mgnify:CR=1 FL=1
MARVLVVDDEKLIVKGIRFSLEQDGYEVDCAYDGDEAIDRAKEREYDVVLLDVMLPGHDGFEVCQTIREFSEMPIIMLTARDSESDQVLGLEMGADEYVTKPFSTIALIARIKALYRRTQLNQLSSSTQQIASDFDVQTPHFKLNSKTREAFLDDQQIENLTPKEFDLLKTLASKPKQVFTREQLLQLVWNYEYYGDERTVDAHIKKLRQKIEKAGPQVIQTVWGVGYKFDDSEVEDQ